MDYQDDIIYQLVHRDNEQFVLSETRNARITFTHEAKVFGQGLLKSLNTYIAIPDNLNQQTIQSIRFEPNQYNEKTDRWDQKLAVFNFSDKGGESILTAKMVVESEISEIQYFIFPDECGILKDIPKDVSNKYTADGCNLPHSWAASPILRQEWASRSLYHIPGGKTCRKYH